MLCTGVVFAWAPCTFLRSTERSRAASPATSLLGLRQHILSVCGDAFAVRMRRSFCGGAGRGSAIRAVAGAADPVASLELAARETSLIVLRAAVMLVIAAPSRRSGHRLRG